MYTKWPASVEVCTLRMLLVFASFVEDGSDYLHTAVGSVAACSYL